MSENIRSGIGFLFPFGGLIGFVLSIFAEQYVIGIIFVVVGVLGWFIYMAVMNTPNPPETGNIMILSGALISLGVFLTYGLSKNMFGGIEFRPEGIIMSLIILFFTLLFGMVFKRTIPSENTAPSLTDKEAALVRNALDEDDADNTKVIIVKQDDAEKGSEETNEWDYQNYNPYMYAYPPEYYDDENYDYDDYEE